MSYVLQILGKFIFFEDVQMIVKSVLDIFNGAKVTKNPKACGSILEQSLDKHLYLCQNQSLFINLQSNGIKELQHIENEYF